MKVHYSLLACAALLFTSISASDRARIIASKKVLNHYMVQNQDILIEFSLYNVGTAPALDVSLTDNSFPVEHWTHVAGHQEVKFDRIAPSANVSHSFVVRSIGHGVYNFTAGEIRYRPSEEATEEQTGYTSAPGQGLIVEGREYERMFSSHLLDWTMFTGLLLPVLLVPFLMWRNINLKYELSNGAQGSSKTK